MKNKKMRRYGEKPLVSYGNLIPGEGYGLSPMFVLHQEQDTRRANFNIIFSRMSS
jgi:hypothetical protein